MTKKIFLLLPIALLFTACSNKESQVNLNENKTNEITLSYGEYKKLYEAKNKKVKNLPIANYEPIITPKEYKKLLFNDQAEVATESTATPKIKKQAFTDFYSEWKDVRYKMGGTSKSGIDCSGFTQKVYKEKFGVSLPRTTVTQVDLGVEVKKSELIPGDLVFFKTSKTDKHVGVYVGNGEFLHASIKGIQFTKLDKPFYKKNYWTSRRIID
ncbi:MAG: C40 family peptidase [Aliarcobacter sp.]|jgi:lipoprotein Spr|nr:C40 family peptidase [Aliarcobacter sp.]MDX9960185.1 NlpC/P60 family protein [Aliarcobacter sp.]